VIWFKGRTTWIEPTEAKRVEGGLEGVSHG
jgi:hypothetical protein